MASTGHSATHSVQSMHSSGSITSMLGPSRKQSTGHTSTQSVYLHLMQLSVTTYAMGATSPPVRTIPAHLAKTAGILSCTVPGTLVISWKQTHLRPPAY